MTTRRRPQRRTFAIAVVVLLAVGATVPLAAGAATTPASALSVSGSDDRGPAGGTVTVTYTVTNDGDAAAVAPVLRLDDLPPGWRVVDQASGEATWRPDAGEWLWLRIDPGESRTVELTLAIPETADGTRSIPVTLTDADGRTADGTATVTVTAASGIGGDVPGIAFTVALAAGILLVGWLAGRRVGARVRGVVAKTPAGEAIARSPVGTALDVEDGGRIDAAIGAVVRYYVYLLAVLVLADVLELAALGRFTATVLEASPAVAGGLIVLAAGLFAVEYATGAVRETVAIDVPTRAVGLVVGALIVVVAADTAGADLGVLETGVGGAVVALLLAVVLAAGGRGPRRSADEEDGEDAG